MNLSCPTWFNQQFTRADGSPVSYGRVKTYKAGTTEEAITYDHAGNANSNPIILDIAGSREIYVNVLYAYKFVVHEYDPTMPEGLGEIVDNCTRDNVYGAQFTTLVTAGVLSVNGDEGPNVILAAADVGALGATETAVDSAKLGGELPAFYAQDSTVVHKTGNESIGDTKTFTKKILSTAATPSFSPAGIEATDSDSGSASLTAMNDPGGNQEEAMRLQTNGGGNIEAVATKAGLAKITINGPAGGIRAQSGTSDSFVDSEVVPGQASVSISGSVTGNANQVSIASNTSSSVSVSNQLSDSAKIEGSSGTGHPYFSIHVDGIVGDTALEHDDLKFHGVSLVSEVGGKVSKSGVNTIDTVLNLTTDYGRTEIGETTEGAENINAVSAQNGEGQEARIFARSQANGGEAVLDLSSIYGAEIHSDHGVSSDKAIFAPSFQSIEQSSFPIGTTYTWDLSIGQGLSINLSFSTGDFTITTSNPVLANKISMAVLEAIGHGSSARNLSLTQSGVTWIYNGVGTSTTLSLGAISISKKHYFRLTWVSTTLCFVENVGNDDSKTLNITPLLISTLLKKFSLGSSRDDSTYSTVDGLFNIGALGQWSMQTNGAMEFHLNTYLNSSAQRIAIRTGSAFIITMYCAAGSNAAVMTINFAPSVSAGSVQTFYEVWSAGTEGTANTKTQTISSTQTAAVTANTVLFTGAYTHTIPTTDTNPVGYEAGFVVTADVTATVTFKDITGSDQSVNITKAAGCRLKKVTTQYWAKI